MERLDLFPTVIYRFNSEADTAKLAERVLELEVGKDLHYGQDSGGLQGGGLILQDIDFNYTHYWIKEQISKTFNRKFTITDVWVSIYDKGDYNKIHNHPPTNPTYYDNEMWAGVFYIKTNDEGGELLIHSPQNATNTYDIKPREGELILFNSNTYHSVTPNQSDEKRICLAFNFILENEQ